MMDRSLSLSGDSRSAGIGVSFDSAIVIFVAASRRKAFFRSFVALSGYLRNFFSVASVLVVVADVMLSAACASEVPRL
jgi:hypothetical protein